jgi:uncharacterized protein YbbC (DUF1343 family)
MKRRGFITAGVAAGAAVIGGCGAASSSSAGEPSSPGTTAGGVRTGFAQFAAGRYQQVAGRKLGFIANPTSVTGDLTHEADVMHGAAEVNLVAVFGPEHGFRGTAQAGGGEGTTTDAKTGLPVYNLYGTDVASTVSVIRQSGVESLVFDIQDAGARFYTYIWTMYLSMVAAAVLEIPFLVLDRPNPLGGLRPSGPVVRPGLETFVGMKPISQQHAMTAGELARLFNAEFVSGDAGGKQADLTVVPMTGWRRGMSYAQTGLPWVMPSPNMPTPDTASVYYGTCLFEGTNLSEGRGTTRPFELVTAPYADYRWADTLDAELTAIGLAGAARFREEYVQPGFDKYSGQVCGGVQVYITNAGAFDAITTAVAMLVTAKKLYAGDFGWQYPGRDPLWIDKLSGSSWIRTSVDAGRPTREIVAGWQADLAEFARLREKYLLYR